MRWNHYSRSRTFSSSANTYSLVCVALIAYHFGSTEITIVLFPWLESWLVGYLEMCSQAEQEKCLQFINKVLSQINNVELQQQYSEQYLKLMQSIFKFVLPYVKRTFPKSNVFSSVPEIAATFCQYASGQNGLPAFDEQFKYFTETTCCDTQ